MLEVGCGHEGGVAPALAAAGYDVLAIDPHAPEGPLYRQITLEELDDPGPFDAVVAGRVLHHVDPLAPALDKLGGARAAAHPRRVRVEPHGRAHDRLVRVAAPGARRGRTRAEGPSHLAEWRARHTDLHPYETLRAEIDARYDERHFEWRPYFYRWLEGPATESLEAGLIAAGAIRPIGFRYAGVSKETVRSPADSR